MRSAPTYGLALAVVAFATAAGFAVHGFLDLTNIVMVYLLGTLVVAMRGRRGPAALSAALGVLCFDYFFVPPRFTFQVADTQYIFTFIVMFAVALIISHLAVGMRAQAEAARLALIEAEKERLRSSLLSSVSHDLRTPLAGIIGSAESLLQPGASIPPAARDLLENIQSEGERLSRLVDNLIETTRLETGGARLRKEPQSIEEIAGAALGRVEKLLAGRTVQTQIPEDLPLVPLDSVLIEQVLINLLENACRHTPGGTPLELSARAEAGLLKVEVSDRGPGLAADELERVFEKFYHSRSPAAGAGLGLAICRAVVDAHGGRIRAENRPGGGVAFRFTLPLEETLVRA